jgi:hypothetical protein
MSMLVSSQSDANNLLWSWSRQGLLARSLRATKMRTNDAFMNELAASLQFPWYFGQNWAAADECLSDLEWLPIENGVRLLIYSAAELLADEPSVLPTAISLFQEAAAEYSTPIELGSAGDRPAIQFEVILQAEPRDSALLIDRWREAGADLPKWPAPEAPSATENPSGA